MSTQQTDTTNLKDEYFGFAGEAATVLYRLKQVINGDDFVSAVQDAIVTVAQYGYRKTVTISVILTCRYNNK